MMGLEVAVGDQRSPSQWWLWVHVVLCVCRCGKNVKESLSAKRLDFVCLLHAIQWGDWVAGTASGHTRNLSLAAGGIYAVHINKHAQTYIWTVLSYIYTYIYPSEQGAGALMTLSTGPSSCSARGAGTACAHECSVGAPVLTVWPAVYICVYIAYTVTCWLLMHIQPCCWRDQLFNQTRRK